MNNPKMDFDRFSDTVLQLWFAGREQTTCEIIGNSMAPVIRNGDLLTIQHGAGNIRIGDVVVFRSDARAIAHRVVRKHSDAGTTRFLLKGDASGTFDPPVANDRILGKIVQINGRRGNLHLESGLWRFMNFLIATFSYLSGRSRTRDSLHWKGIRKVGVVISEILPERFSYIRVLFKCTCLLEKSLSTPALHKQHGKT